MMKKIKILLGVLFVIIIVLFIFPLTSEAKTFYLDAQLSQNCSGNYSTTNRSCSGVDGTAYNNLNDAVNALAGGDTLYVRNGIYYRTTNDYFSGALAVNVAGTASQHTVVSNYGTEQPVICTSSTKCNYNPDPSDTTYTNSSHYYPNPAISIGANYVDVMGFKTYGQVLVRGASASKIHDITIQNSDLGGGGPHLNQGNVVLFHDVYDVTLKNNKIHNSSWGESNANGPAVMGYRFAATIENNEFYDNWGSDIRLKDTQSANGYSTHIRYNFFKPSSIATGSNNSGVSGINQYSDLDYIYIYNNIFYNKPVGIVWDTPANYGTFAYNNTFINNSVDISNWMTTQINTFNNLYYHSVSSQIYIDVQANPLSLINSDFNLHYSADSTARWRNLYANRGTTLVEWQTYSSKDINSVYKNPNFVNPTGSTPADFKRTSYSGDVSGSSYGAVAGAYETGNEIIGLYTSISTDTTPPSSPSGLAVS